MISSFWVLQSLLPCVHLDPRYLCYRHMYNPGTPVVAVSKAPAPIANVAAASVVAKAPAAPPAEPPVVSTPEPKMKADQETSPADLRSPDPKRTKCDGGANGIFHELRSV